MKGKVALVIIFNHRYDKNFELLEKFYYKRFTDIYFLVPFYDGEKPQVIPVYESSFYFEGYISQGFKHFFKAEYEHFIFVADDLLLNPEVNEFNYKEYFHLGAESSFIPEVFSLGELTNDETLLFTPYLPWKDRVFANKERKRQARYYWWRMKGAVNYNPQKEGVETGGALPDISQAEALLKEHGKEAKALGYVDVYGGCPIPRSPGKLKAFLNFVVSEKITKKKYPLQYPLVASYSDIVIVAASSIKKFCQYCGAFAATELFVEFAIPTALLLSCRKVVTEPDLGKRGKIYWVYSPAQKDSYEKDMNEYQYSIENLITRFPKEKLYIHPIKLSKWKKENT